MMKRVRKVTQSPLNKLRWCLDLECGHEVWITKGYRPLLHSANCLKCDVDRILNDPKAIERIADGSFSCIKPTGTNCPRARSPKPKTPRVGPVKTFIRWALEHNYIDNFTKDIDKETERIYKAYIDSYKR